MLLHPGDLGAASLDLELVDAKAATGAVTARVPSPYAGHGSLGLLAVSVAAGDGGREFVATYTGVPPHSRADQTRLYSFHLASAGRVTGLSLVKGSVLGGLAAGRTLAVSPDGSKAALAASRPIAWARSSVTGPDRSDRPEDRRAQPVEGRPAAPRVRIQHPEHLLGTRRPLPGLPRPVVPQPGRRVLRARAARRPGAHTPAGRRRRPTFPTAASCSGRRRYPHIVQALLNPGGKAPTLVVLRGLYLAKSSSIPQDLG